MSLPITNNFTTTNQYNDNLSEERTESAEFSDFEVYTTSPTSSIQEQAETSQTNVTDRLSTPANSLNKITIKPFCELGTKDRMLDYFKDKIALLYKSHGFAMNSKLERYIDQKKTNKLNDRNDKDKEKIEKLCRFFRRLTILLFVHFKQKNNEIFDIIDALFCQHLLIRPSLMDNFINLTDKQIQELAANKDFYRSLLLKQKLEYIDLNNIEDFTKSRIKYNKKQEKKICSFIDKSSADKARKDLIQEHATKIFTICSKKDIDIDTNLESIINTLANSTQLTNADTKEILEKIIFFFNSFDDYNTIIDTSILTDIICYEHEKTNEQLLLSICNLNNEQIQFITSCKNRWKIMQPWIFKGFPATKKIAQIINHFKKNNTNYHSTKNVIIKSTYPSKPQPNTIALTETEDSHLASVALDPEQIDDDISKEIDCRRIVNAHLTGNNENFDSIFLEWLGSSRSPTSTNFQDTDKALAPEQIDDDIFKDLDNRVNKFLEGQNTSTSFDLFSLLNDNSNFLAKPNTTTNSNPELIPHNKRSISPSLYSDSEEHNRNKIPKLDF